MIVAERVCCRPRCGAPFFPPTRRGFGLFTEGRDDGDVFCPECRWELNATPLDEFQRQIRREEWDYKGKEYRFPWSRGKENA